MVELRDEVVAAPASGHVDAVGRIETRGMDYIPEEERHSRPQNLAWVFIGAEACIGIIFFGSLPLAFGLGWWASWSAITVGLLLGSLVYAPSALIGPKTGTNSGVSSGAFFGIRARFIGSGIALFTGLGFSVIMIWIAGQTIIDSFHRLAGTSTGNGALAIAIAVVAILTVVLGIYGHANLVASFKFITITSGLILIVLVFLVVGKFQVVHGSHYLLGSFWPTWILALTTSASLPISYGPFVNDYARYIPSSAKPSRLMFYNGVGIFVGLWVALTVGAVVTATFTNVGSDFVSGMVNAVPAWYTIPLMFVALTANVGNAALGVYEGALDIQSYLWRVPRAVIAGALGILLIVAAYLSVIVFNEINAVNAFVTIMVVTLSPWLAIMILGHFLRRGWYVPRDLQAFARRGYHGAYWFWLGFNPRAIIAWAVGVTVGFLFTNTTLVTGPYSNAVGGVDLSWSSSLVTGALLYFVLLKLFPESGPAVEPPLVPVEETAAPPPVGTVVGTG